MRAQGGWRRDGRGGAAAWCGHCARWHHWLGPQAPPPGLDVGCPHGARGTLEPDSFPAGSPWREGPPAMTRDDLTELACQGSGLGWLWHRELARPHGHRFGEESVLVLALGSLELGHVRRRLPGASAPPLFGSPAPAEAPRTWWVGAVAQARPLRGLDEVGFGPDLGPVRQTVVRCAAAMLPAEVREMLLSY